MVIVCAFLKRVCSTCMCMLHYMLKTYLTIMYIDMILPIQICSDHASYYRDALRYLGCMEINDIPGAFCILLFVCNIANTHNLYRV